MNSVEMGDEIHSKVPQSIVSRDSTISVKIHTFLLPKVSIPTLTFQ